MISEAVKEQFIKLRAEGLSFEKISQQLKVSKPTRGMTEEAVKEGTFDYSFQTRPEDIQGTIQTKIPKIQTLTVEDLFTDPIPVKLPPGVIEPYRKPDIKKEVKGAGLF